MEIENYIIGLIVFCIGIGIFALAISDLNDHYTINVEDKWVGMYDKMNETRTNIEGMENNLLSNQSITATDYVVDYFAGGFKAIIGIFTLIPVGFSLITTMVTQFQIPPVIFWGLSSILLISIIFAVIKFIRNA